MVVCELAGVSLCFRNLRLNFVIIFEEVEFESINQVFTVLAVAHTVSRISKLKS